MKQSLEGTIKCKNCRHYGFYQMITQGSYGYAGKIPCLTCSRFSSIEDNYESVAEYVKDGECNCNAGGYSESTAVCSIHGVNYGLHNRNI